MSYTELFKVPERGEIELVAEFQNAFRGAFLVWNNLAQRYLGIDESILRDMHPVWALAKDGRVSYELRIVLMTTFDNVMVKREHLPIVAKAFEVYCHSFPDSGHLDQQAKKLRELAWDETCYAVCWNQTSVNCDTWRVVDEAKGIDDDDRYRFYDISRDTGHWFLFANTTAANGENRP